MSHTHSLLVHTAAIMGDRRDWMYEGFDIDKFDAIVNKFDVLKILFNLMDLMLQILFIFVGFYGQRELTVMRLQFI